MKVNYQKNHSAKLGFTIVELLLYMGLLSGFLLILSALFVSTLETQADLVGVAHVDQDSWYLFNHFQHELYQADSIITPAEDGQQSNQLVLDVDGSQITYSLASGKLLRTEAGNPIPLVSSGVQVSNLSFLRLGNDDRSTSISVQMQVQGTGVQPRNLDFTVGVRQ